MCRQVGVVVGGTELASCLGHRQVELHGHGITRIWRFGRKVETALFVSQWELLQQVPKLLIKNTGREGNINFLDHRSVYLPTHVLGGLEQKEFKKKSKDRQKHNVCDLMDILLIFEEASLILNFEENLVFYSTNNCNLNHGIIKEAPFAYKQLGLIMCTCHTWFKLHFAALPSERAM